MAKNNCINAPLTFTVPDGGTGLSSCNTGDTLYGSSSNVLSALPIGTVGASHVVSDSGIPIWSKAAGVSDIMILEDDFIYESMGTDGPIAPWFNILNGGTVLNPIAASTNIGVWALSTTNGTGNECAITRGANNDSGQVILGGGYHDYLMYVQIPTLATSGDNFVFTCGLGTNFGGFYSGEPGNDAVFFQYNMSSSTSWFAGTRESSSTTTCSGTLPLVTTGWTLLRFTINAAATLVTFYINGVLIGTCTTNITSAALGPGFKIRKTAGTNARSANIDYFRWYCRMTTPRF